MWDDVLWDERNFLYVSVNCFKLLELSTSIRILAVHLYWQYILRQFYVLQENIPGTRYLICDLAEAPLYFTSNCCTRYSIVYLVPGTRY